MKAFLTLFLIAATLLSVASAAKALEIHQIWFRQNVLYANWFLTTFSCWLWSILFVWFGNDPEFFYRCYNGFYNGVVWYQPLVLLPYGG